MALAGWLAIPGACIAGGASEEVRWTGECGGRAVEQSATLVWSTYLGGGTTIEEGYAVALDEEGNVVVAGYTYSADFPATPGAYDVTFNGAGDGFVAKVSAAGDELIWCTFLGGSGYDCALSVGVDAAGDVIVAGASTSAGFPTTMGAFDPTPNGDYDGFVAKLSSSGDSLMWSTMLGGPLSDWIYALVLDASGNAVVAGRTFSANFPTTPGAYDTTHGGKRDVFVARISSTGDVLLSSTFLGSTGSEWGYNLSLDEAGNVLVTGVTDSQDFPTTPGAYDQTFNGGTTDAFVTKRNLSMRMRQFWGRSLV
jgi:hypothetical protein